MVAIMLYGTSFSKISGQRWLTVSQQEQQQQQQTLFTSESTKNIFNITHK